jgi:hypothetical protein
MRSDLKKSVLLISAVMIAITSYAQKPKKTFDSNKFAQKVQFSMVPELIGKWLPDDVALQYIADKSGKSLTDLKEEKTTNAEHIKQNTSDFIAHGLAYIVDKVEVQVIEESPVKRANILMHCHAKQGNFIIKLSNCVQTNLSWYLGDSILPEGDGFESAVTAKAEKKPSKLGSMLAKADEIQKSSDEANKKDQTAADALRQTRPGYEATSSKYYNHDLADLPLAGYYIKKNGEKVEAIIGYQKPQFLIGLSNALFICKQADGKKIDALNAESDPNFKEWVKYEDIKAFYVADQLHARNSEGYFTVIISEGAIHTTASIKLWNKETQLFKVFPVTQKLNGQKAGTFLDRPTEAELLSMMTDAPDIVDGYKNGEYTLNEAEIKYNVWYEAKNPGKVNYIFGKDYGVTKNSSSVAAQEVTEYDKEVVAAADEAHRAPKIDKFAGRPTTAEASVASAKPEVEVKKESFKDRLNRVKSDGNKVGVLVTSKNLVINPNDFSEGITKAQVMGSYGPLTDLDNLAKATTDQLNAGFGIDVFEAVDYSKIPVKEGKYGKLDDWWSTKYKVIVIYELTPFYNAYYKTNTQTGDREYNAQMRVDSEMIVMAAEQEKPEKLKYVTASPKSWGNYRSEKYTAPAETDYHMIQELKAAINPPSDDVVMQELIKSQKEYLDKFVKKKSK